VALLDEVIERLRADPLRHIVALKMLGQYPEHARLELREAGPAWAVSAVFPASVSAYDARAYPTAEFLALIDGNAPSSMLALLDELPHAPLVLKTSHRAIARRAVRRGGRFERAFLSFSSIRALTPEAAPVTEGGPGLDPALARAFAHHGNDLEYLDHCFRNGARWFAIRDGAAVCSACLVYRNFDPIWEIAGLFTQPEWRRQGLARRVVTAALRYLHAHNRQPRYQVDTANRASIELARALGLAELLRVEHVSLRAGFPPQRG
jgi:ribosomal protein S18 acetylase RimI-like enzyme